MASNTQILEQTADVNGIQMNYLIAGDSQAPLVLLLHGFPQHCEVWRETMSLMAFPEKWDMPHRFCVVAPDLRGYGKTQRTSTGYDIDTLTDDILGLIQFFRARSAHIIGHNWGGTLALWMATRYPHYVNKLCVMGTPHPAALIEDLTANPVLSAQYLWLSCYGLGWNTEWLLTTNDYALIRWGFEQYAGKKKLSQKAIDGYLANIAQSGAMHAALSYYAEAANLAQQIPRQARTVKDKEVLILQGDRDQVISSSMLQGIGRYFPLASISDPLEGVGYFIPDEAPHALVNIVVPFLTDAQDEQKPSRVDVSPVHAVPS